MLSGVLALDPDSKPSSQPFPRVQCNTSRPAPRLVLQIGRGRSLSRSMYNSNTMICYIGASTRQGVTAEGDSAIAERPWLQLTTQETAPRAGRCYPGAVLDPDRHTHRDPPIPRTTQVPLTRLVVLHWTHRTHRRQRLFSTGTLRFRDGAGDWRYLDCTSSLLPVSAGVISSFLSNTL